MSEFWRKIPHPTYGNYGGKRKTGNNYTATPIDPMDYLFRLHDMTLLYNEDPLSRALADISLFNGLKDIKNKDLAKPIYGRFFKYGCIAVFYIIKKINEIKGVL